MTDHAEALAKALEDLEAKAQAQKDYFEKKQQTLPSLERLLDDEGMLVLPDDISPLLDHSHANGRYSEADWWLSTIRSALAAYRSRPAAEVVAEDEIDIEWIMTAHLFCDRLGIERKADAHHIISAINKLATPALAGTEPAGEVVEKPRELWKIAARELSDEDLAADLKEAERKFDNRGEHGGSPGEFWHERMDEIESEQARRRKAAFFQSEA